MLRIATAPPAADGTGGTLACAVQKQYLEASSAPLTLLNACSESTELRSLRDLLNRIEDLSHVLVWAMAAEGEAEGEGRAVHLVELPRLQLSFLGVPPARSTKLRAPVARASAATEPPPAAGVFREGSKVRLYGTRLVDELSGAEVERTDRIFRPGDRIRLDGPSVVHVATGRRVSRLDPLVRHGDELVFDGAYVLHVRSEVALRRCDRQRGRGQRVTLRGAVAGVGERVEVDVPPIDDLLDDLGGAGAAAVQMAFYNAPAVGQGEELTLPDFEQALDGRVWISAEEARADAGTADADAERRAQLGMRAAAAVTGSPDSLSFAFRNVTAPVDGATDPILLTGPILLGGLKGLAGEELRLSVPGVPGVVTAINPPVDASAEAPWRLKLVEFTHLFVYAPPRGVPWPASMRALVDDLPHAICLLSDTQVPALLVRNLSVHTKSSAHDIRTLVPDYHDATWAERASSPYHLYEMHASGHFLRFKSATSALYLCLMRFLAGRFAECFRLLDSCEFDGLGKDECQVLRLFGEPRLPFCRQTTRREASACLLKLACVVEAVRAVAAIEHSFPLMKHALHCACASARRQLRQIKRAPPSRLLHESRRLACCRPPASPQAPIR